MTEFIRAPKSNRFVTPASTFQPPLAEKPLIQSIDTLTAPYRTNPLGFVLDTFAWGKPGSRLADKSGPRAWQIEVLEAVGLELEEQADYDSSIVRIAIASGKGVGKTALAAWLFLWHVSCFRDSLTIATSVTGFQSHSRFWREVRIWRALWTLKEEFVVQSTRLEHRMSETWVGMHQTWNLDRIEAFQGAHENYLGYVVDEASAVPDELFEVIETGAIDKHVFILYISNPTRPKGKFRECFRGQRGQLWQTWNIDSRTVEEINKDRIAEQLAEVNGDEETSGFRKNVRGLFPLEDYDGVIPEWIIAQAVARHERCSDVPVLNPFEPVCIGADIARKGQNKTVFTVRQGKHILERMIYAKQELNITRDALQTLVDKYRWVLREYPQVRLRAYVDSDGLGAGIVDEMQAAGYPEVIALHSGAAATYADRYGNRRAELWFACRDWLKTEACLASTCLSLHEQLTDIYFHHDALNRVFIESKEDMLARGVASPDEADSLIYSFGGNVFRTVEVRAYAY